MYQVKYLYACALLLVLSSLVTCRSSHRAAEQAVSHSEYRDSLVLLSSSMALEHWARNTLSTDSTMLTILRYDSLGRIRERLTYQANKRTQSSGIGSKQTNTADSIKAGIEEANQEVEVVTQSTEVTPSLGTTWWLWIVTALVVGTFAILVIFIKK